MSEFNKHVGPGPRQSFQGTIVSKETLERILKNVEELTTLKETVLAAVSRIEAAEAEREAAEELRRRRIHIGEFNANTTTEEGWYDSVVLGRPEGAESDEKFYMYQSPNGGQMCWSRRNSGKVYHRLGNGAAPNTEWHPWVATSHDDYGLQHATAIALQQYSKVATLRYTSWTHDRQNGYAEDENTELAEVYAGNELNVHSLHLYQQVQLHPNDIIKVRCLYRRGFSAEGVNNYPFDSDAYIYVSDQADEGHDLAHLKSDYIKVRSLGSWNFPFTEEQKGWQDLAFARDIFFQGDAEYGWHYIKANVPEAGVYYLHLAGDFSSPGSWFVVDVAEVYTGN